MNPSEVVAELKEKTCIMAYWDNQAGLAISFGKPFKEREYNLSVGLADWELYENNGKVLTNWECDDADVEISKLLGDKVVEAEINEFKEFWLSFYSNKKICIKPYVDEHEYSQWRLIFPEHNCLKLSKTLEFKIVPSNIYDEKD